MQRTSRWQLQLPRGKVHKSTGLSFCVPVEQTKMVAPPGGAYCQIPEAMASLRNSLTGDGVVDEVKPTSTRMATSSISLFIDSYT